MGIISLELSRVNPDRNIFLILNLMGIISLELSRVNPDRNVFFKMRN